jgi:hypothetical protein
VKIAEGRFPLLRSVGPFTAIVLLQALLAGISMDTLTSVRAYVVGESLWSKGQKEAIYSLSLYVETGEEKYYRRYQSTISVPLGDRIARRALEQQRPDPQAAYDGFLQGDLAVSKLQRSQLSRSRRAELA